jgi:NAD(P)-dependent dehydrogenase (short-subunit alcohol dehydrogenase family)
MQGKVVVVTGAFGVLGVAASELARAMSAQVAEIDYASAPANLRADPLVIGGVDLSKAEDAAAAMARVRESAGRIDALLNIAGGFVWSTLQDSDEATWERMHRINLKTTVNASRAALPHLIESGGAIVNVGAFGALRANAGFGAYAASKAGVHKLTESLAEEMKGKVRINAVLPSIIDTPANRADMPDTDPAIWVAPDHLAAVILFLASEASTAMTGALVPVTGQV